MWFGLLENIYDAALSSQVGHILKSQWVYPGHFFANVSLKFQLKVRAGVELNID